MISTMPGAARDAAIIPFQADLMELLERLQRYAAPTPVPLSEWRDKVLERYRPPRPRSTRVRMTQAMAELLAIFPAEASTLDVTRERVEELAERLRARGLAGSTVNGLMRGVRAACGLAVEWGWSPRTPFAGFRGWVDEAEDEPRDRPHSREDVARVLAWLRERSVPWEGHRLYALACLFAYTGLRKLEGLRLRAEEVDLAAGVVFVCRSKGRRLKTRSSAAPVPIPAALGEVLAGWLPRAGSDWVFPGKLRDRPWTEGRTGKRPTDRLKQAGEAAGVEGFTPASLRHTLATHLTGWWGLTRGQVRLVLRHTNETTQAHYVHPEMANLVGLVRGFGYGGDGTAQASMRPTGVGVRSTGTLASPCR
jgi:integrase